tara:strand:+ start:542 stop:718 length:177 start_codon:yes stop_codon:yes gene_type:complete
MNRGYFIHLALSKNGGWMLTLFRFFGIGGTIIRTKKEHSITFTIRIWKFSTFLTFSFM